jgi:hypothetical protein
VEDDAMISTQAAQQSSASDGSQSFFTQSTRFCSDSVTILPYFFAWAPSIEATVLKVQHEPQDPWSFTSATRPSLRQSTSVGNCVPVVLWTSGACLLGEGLYVW